MIRRLPYTTSSCYHDFEYYSVFYGEPFLYKDFIYYFDGWDLRVVGYDRCGNAIKRQNFESLIDTTMNRWRVRSISLECPVPIRLGRPFQFLKRELLSRPGRGQDFEFITRRDVSKTRKILKVNRRIKREGIETSVAKKRRLSSQHFRLIDEFIRNWEPCPYYKSEYISSIFYLLSKPRTIMVNAYTGCDLLGFALGYMLGNFGVFRILITKPRIRWVSDALHFKMLSEFWRLEATEVSLGFSINAGLSDFKRKWGGVESWKGSYEILWSKYDMVPNNLWATRLVRAN